MCVRDCDRGGMQPWLGRSTGNPAHGWEAERGEEQVALRLSYRTPVTEFLVERRLVLRAGERKFRIEYGFTNEGGSAMAFLWKLHPAFAVTGRHRIDMPAMTVVREP